MIDTTPTRVRWLHPTPGRFVLALLAVEVLLWLSERFGWLGWHKGYAVLTCVAVVGVAMVLVLVWFGVAVVFWRRFQFSLRSLLVLVVVVALPCSWLAVEMRAAMRQKESVELIAASAGRVSFDIQDVDNDTRGRFLFDRDPPGQTLNVYQNLRLPSLIPRPPLPEPIRGLFVRLFGESFFCTATAVSHIDLDEPQWHGDVLMKPSPDKYDEEREEAHSIMIALKGLPKLQTLDISGTPVDDSDLEYISPLKDLRQLALHGTKVTAEGVAKLQKALPNCKITR